MTESVSPGDWVACPECDLIHRRPAVDGPYTARCRRCGSVLFAARGRGVDAPLALTLAGLVLFGLANAFPLMSFAMAGRHQENTLVSGSVEFWNAGFQGLAVLVFLTAILFPALRLGTMAYVLLPLRLGRVAWRAAWAFRLSRRLRPWAMVEVYMLGVFVAIVKLKDYAEVVPGVALYCFMALILIGAAAEWMLDARAVWQRLEAAR